MVVASAFATMPRTVVFASGSKRPTERQPEPRSSLNAILPPAAAQIRCGRVAWVATVSTGAAASPRPAMRQLRAPSGLIIARPSMTAARTSADPGIATSVVISTTGGGPGAPGYIRRACPDRCPRGFGAQPTALIATKYTIGCRAHGRLAVRREDERKHRPDDEVARFRHPGPAPIARTQDSQIGASQQMRRIVRIDRNDERRIEKQADIRIQPDGAKIAGAKHTAIAARIMRRRAAGHQGQHAGKTEGQPTHADLLFSNSSMKRSGWDHGSPPENTCHGLRDFSPGASVSSAIRPPFNATQEFLVSGYLS